MDHRNERQANASLQAAADKAAADHLAALRRTGQAAMPEPASAPQTPTALKILWLCMVLGIVLLWLAGCCGGDPEPTQPNTSLHCALNPVACK